MSLIIYDKLADIPEGTKYVYNPSLYFELGQIPIPDTEEVRHLLKVIDRATYFDKEYVNYPWNIGAYHSRVLSSGMKALLCIMTKPDICFNVNICGPNVLSQILHFKSGLVHLSFPYIGYSNRDREDCDVIWRGERFVNVYDFLSYVVATLKEEED